MEIHLLSPLDYFVVKGYPISILTVKCLTLCHTITEIGCQSLLATDEKRRIGAGPISKDVICAMSLIRSWQANCKKLPQSESMVFKWSQVTFSSEYTKACSCFVASPCLLGFAAERSQVRSVRSEGGNPVQIES